MACNGDVSNVQSRWKRSIMHSLISFHRIADISPIFACVRADVSPSFPCIIDDVSPRFDSVIADISPRCTCVISPRSSDDVSP
ncbi:UNVERIFIED_CONTAM: hypothetical protein Sindi_2636000 [Sesamum indicum]